MNYTPLTELTADSHTIELSRVETPKGERLEIKTPTSSIRLDAVALEALTWQDNETLAALPDADTDQVTSASDMPKQDERTQLTVISNEFGFVVVHETLTEAGVRIDLEAEKQDESIQLCPSELKTLAQQDQNLFTQWVRSDLNE